MSGHSKWATTKRHKAVIDAKRSSIFTKLGNNITIAARKGGDPELNFSLRMAIEKARSFNMPKENVERAVKRGTGELGGATVEELTYEGFGPAKAGFIIEVLTDNKNRAGAEIRHLLAKHGGALGASNSVSWNFNRLGVIRIAAENLQNISHDELELELIEAGADDILPKEEGLAVLTNIENLKNIKKLLDDKNIKTESAEIEYIAKDEKKLGDEDKEKVEQFIEALEENEDVSNYYTDVTL
ncbi:YebC/PmpR family DNA-binding transcriptional regulator [Candidatus Falkowbacteria bacterium CG10_big_fil_rev_8_21_14_0_10_43_10]|uniref:Probable transcriptional regulatory protein COT99_00690 n=1 Tax=Candidatus Falkowbacteria bacterium CG10_big_fil_rev_8_21_14_0_10_43_10 TaxID=1974567 RepID=A0A2H0V530_9BACT|nr:MAG: YebC/PmpR family DNA-binding transcriptional regulator [Candidatus Falkowbacteria bacterium CG10_big_fil_rev_8_21_14_0_10_43_10]